MHKKSGGLGSKLAFCGLCVKLDGMSASTLWRKISFGEIVLEGLCLHENREACGAFHSRERKRRDKVCCWRNRKDECWAIQAIKNQIKEEILTAHNQDAHVTKGNHIFPQGFSSVDRMIDIACAPGGMMAVSTHWCRKRSPGAMEKIFKSVASDDTTPGASNANCYGLFHRKFIERMTQKHTASHGSCSKNWIGCLPSIQKYLLSRLDAWWKLPLWWNFSVLEIQYNHHQ